MTGNGESDSDSEKPGRVPAGTGRAGRTPPGAANERRRTVKTRKSGGGKGLRRKRTGNTTTRKPPGRNVPNGVTEAVQVLRNEGYIVGKVDDQLLPFNLIPHRDRETISIMVIRPRELVTNAADVRQYYSREVLALQPYWNSDADNIQFWLFSRVAGLLRYRVFRCGIWNVETMQNGWQEKRKEKADQESAKGGAAVQKSRTASFPVRATGNV
jgi:hypothetical protein